MPFPVLRAVALVVLVASVVTLAGDGRTARAQPVPKKVSPPGDPKGEPKVDPKGEPKVDPKAEPKADPKVDPKAGPKVDPKAEPKFTEPTAETVAVIAALFQTEREAAVAGKFSAEALAAADDYARRAQAALKDNNPRAAARHYRDARWRLPYLPVNLPPHVLRVLGESRMRHPAWVTSIAYAPSGAALASASKDGTVKVWDLGNGRELAVYRGHMAQPEVTSKQTDNPLGVAAVAYHPKGKMVASAAGKQVHLWNPDTGAQVKILVNIEKAEPPLKTLAFRPDGAALAVGGDDGIVRVFEIATGKETFTSPTRNGRVERVAYSPNGKLIGAVDVNGYAAVYAPGATNTMPMSVGVVPPPGGECMGVGFTLDGGSVFSCARDGKARLTAGPSPTGAPGPGIATLLREYAGHAGGVNDLAVTPDGKNLVTCGDDHTVRVWDVTTGNQLRAFQGHTTQVWAVAVRPDGRQVASAGEDGSIRLWDLTSGDDHRSLTGATGPVWAVGVGPGGKQVAVAGADRTIRVYNPDTGALEATLTGHTGAITSVAFFPEGNRLASAGGDRVIRVWDLGTQKTVAEFSGHTTAILALAIAPDGKSIVSGAADRTARGWDASSGKALWEWSGRSVVTAVGIRPGGKQVALGTAEGRMVLLDVSAPGTVREVTTVPAHVAGVASVSFSPDGSKLATAGGDGVVQVWMLPDPNPPTRLVRFEGQAKNGGFSPVSAVAFAPDGRFIVSAGADAIVRIWDVQTKAEVRGLRGHTDWVTSVAFSPDGRFLVSGSVDKTARVYELIPQEGAGSGGHQKSINAVAVSFDGKTVATASTDNTVRLWELASGKEIGALLGSNDMPNAVTFLGATGVALGGAQPNGAGRIHVWTTTGPRTMTTFVTGQVYTVAGAPDGSRVAAWSVRSVHGDNNKKLSSYEVFDRTAQRTQSIVDKDRQVTSVTFTPDLTWVAAGDKNGAVQIWDLDTKMTIGGLWSLFDNVQVTDIGITFDKKYLVAVDEKGLVKVADVAKRETLGAVTHAGGVSGLLVSPKGDTFLTIGTNHEIKLWSLADPKAIKEARKWAFPIGVMGAAYTPDGKSVVTANADGTAYVLELP